MLTFLLGGARSGKSALAQQMAERSRLEVTIVATAEEFDPDLRARVARHRADRPAGWTTVEEPLWLGRGVREASPDQFLVVDCVTVWLGNLVHRLGTGAVEEEVDHLVEALQTRRIAPTVVVSNEVGLGIHPETELGREYRDLLGRTNQRIAAVADTTLLLVAGRALRLDDPWTALS